MRLGGIVLAIPDTNSLTMTQTSIWFVPSIKENDKQQQARSAHDLPARREKVCEMLRLVVALRAVFVLRVAIKKEASLFLSRLVTSRLFIAFRAGWSQTPVCDLHHTSLLPLACWRSALELVSRKGAPRTGFEPVTYRLTAGRSTVELSRNRRS